MTVSEFNIGPNLDPGWVKKRDMDFAYNSEK